MKSSEVLKAVKPILEDRIAQGRTAYICHALEDMPIAHATLKRIQSRMIAYIGSVFYNKNLIQEYGGHVQDLVGKRAPTHFINFLRIKLIEELIKRFEEEGD